MKELGGALIRRTPNLGGVLETLGTQFRSGSWNGGRRDGCPGSDSERENQSGCFVFDDWLLKQAIKR